MILSCILMRERICSAVTYAGVYIAVVTIMMLNGLALIEANAQTYYLGVLAPQGETAAQQRWQPWLDSLNDQLVDDTIVLVPLELENWQQQIKAQQFALVLGPQIQFIKMDSMGWRWLATLQPYTGKPEIAVRDRIKYKNSDEKKSEQFALAELDLSNENILVNEPSAMEQVASALWVKADSDIYQLQDLQQRKIVAVDPDAFGGYLLVAHALQKNGLPPDRYQTQFVGYPIERTLSTLASGAVDAAITPLCLMEEMTRQGKIDSSQYRLINQVMTISSCQSSTKIYPNWTLAATEQAPAALTQKVNQHLFALQAQSDAIASTNSSTNNTTTAELRWMPPESSIDAERILYEMSRHPAQRPLGAYVFDWIKSHRVWVSLIFFIIIISTINYGWMSWLAWHRRKQILLQNQMLRDYDHRLRQSERFAVMGEMSGAIAHEINQPLATIQNYAQGLLIRSQNSAVNKNKAVNRNKTIEKEEAENDVLNRVALEKQDTEKEAIDKQAVEKEKVESALQQIVNQTERVAAVISNIRRWAGRSQPDEISVDIAATYQQCIMLLGEKAAGISFWFVSDYQQLQLPSLLLDQLFINTMLNAQQQGAAHIMLRCQKVEYEGKPWLVLYITDDAGGFDEVHLTGHQAFNQPSSPQSQKKQQPHQYEQQAVSSTKAGGLGLGLMICQRLCKSLDGMMQLSNVDTQTELDTIKSIDSSYQQRIKRSLNSKIQLIQTDSSYPLMQTTGAQVTLYLPLHLTDTDSCDQSD